MATLTVLAPVTGQVLGLAEVPDPVFSAALVGPGVALDPVHEPRSQVIAPIAGTILKLHPHAFVVQHDDGRAVLVHLGIDTVELGGAGFVLHASRGRGRRRGPGRRHVGARRPSPRAVARRSARWSVSRHPPTRSPRCSSPATPSPPASPLLSWA